MPPRELSCGRPPPPSPPPTRSRLTLCARYDDADTLAWKYQEIAKHGLGGGGMWAANMLDYTHTSARAVWDALLQAVGHA